MSELIPLQEHKNLFVKQVREIGEWIGFETRNKYAIYDSNQTQIAFAAEQSKGILGFLLRQYLGHWRRFDVFFFNNERKLFMTAHHPFRWFFSRVEVKDHEGRYLGAIQKRFAILTKRFDVESSKGLVIMEVASPIWKIWTFLFKHQGKQIAAVHKKWSGVFSEVFTDRDNFMVEFGNQDLTPDERKLVLASAVFIDLLYFEAKR
jgi:uncharacterized protein YxjI